MPNEDLEATFRQWQLEGWSPPQDEPEVAPNGHSHLGFGQLASSVVMAPIHWLWPGRLALGMLNGLDGDPELGKSQLVAYEAAIISTGGTWMDGHRCPKGGVVLVSAEDPDSSVLVP